MTQDASMATPQIPPCSKFQELEAEYWAMSQYARGVVAKW